MKVTTADALEILELEVYLEINLHVQAYSSPPITHVSV
jgi:hypothetical protein